jgi:hypothetical protein
LWSKVPVQFAIMNRDEEAATLKKVVKGSR